MSRQPTFYHWQEQVVNAFAQPGVLSHPQAYVLAILSFGIVRAASCALTAVAGKLSFLGSDNTVLQRLKYWLRKGQDKAVPTGAEIRVRAVFPALIRWVLSLWQGTQLALALDATTLHDDLLILALSLLYRGTAIPLAWAFLPANRKQPWMPIILELLQQVAAVLPAGHEVLLLADRGLYSPRLYQAICHQRWHPLLRVNKQASFRLAQQAWRPIAALLPGPGHQWRGRGHFSKGHALACTLVAFWAPGQQEAWFLITDLGPQRAQAAWYGLRVWIEEGFRILKSLGWQWQRSRITDPQRAERLWLALTLATVWVLAYGTWAEDQRAGPPIIPASAALAETAAPLSAAAITEPVSAYVPPTRPRHKSIFRQGLDLLAEYIWSRKRPLHRLRLVPEPWPEETRNGEHFLFTWEWVQPCVNHALVS
jgi:hypothetical protein